MCIIGGLIGLLLSDTSQCYHWGRLYGVWIFLFTYSCIWTYDGISSASRGFFGKYRGGRVESAVSAAMCILSG